MLGSFDDTTLRPGTAASVLSSLSSQMTGNYSRCLPLQAECAAIRTSRGFLKRAAQKHATK